MADERLGAPELTVRHHTGADFEAGRVHGPNMRVPNAPRADGFDPEEGFGTPGHSRGSSQCGITGFLSGTHNNASPEVVDPADYLNGRRVRQKKDFSSKDITFMGPGAFNNETISEMSSNHGAEDDRWVRLLYGCTTVHTYIVWLKIAVQRWCVGWIAFKRKDGVKQ